MSNVERSPKFEARTPLSVVLLWKSSFVIPLGFVIRHSDFIRISSFGFRHWPRMRLGTVIGRVTLNKSLPPLAGGRWLIVSPFTREHFQRGTEEPRGLSKEPSLVVYDDLGGGVGQTIGFVEGREAASPFDQPTPVDAICAALVDEIFYNPVAP
jgi:microcompartment protein CcmK/EutM